MSKTDPDTQDTSSVCQILHLSFICPHRVHIGKSLGKIYKKASDILCNLAFNSNTVKSIVSLEHENKYPKMIRSH